MFRGPLGMSVKTISDRLAGHDLAVVIGAEVFRYYPYVPDDLLPAGTELLQITASPEAAAAARVGDALLADPKIAIEEPWTWSPRVRRGPPRSRWRGPGCFRRCRTIRSPRPRSTPC